MQLLSSSSNTSAFRFVLLCLAGLLPGCGGGQEPKIVCTTGMVADLVRNVSGNPNDVVQLMGEGVDPHLYQASPGDVAKLDNAKAIFYSGRHLEGKMGDIFQKMAGRKLTVGVADRISEGKLLHDEEGQHDPHLWFDVALWSEGVDIVRDALIELDPGQAEKYQANAAAYRKRLADLHEEVKTKIQQVPRDRRVLVTAHDAFRYFGKAYDIEVEGIQGISTDSEASVNRRRELAQYLAERKIKAVFVESSVNPKYVQALIEDCQKDYNHTVKVGGELFSDAMGKPGTDEGTYEGMIRHNVNTIVEALK
jgi:manganese/zinc/iron transport system substrate-binding protein